MGIPNRYADGRTHKPHTIILTGPCPSRVERMKCWAEARVQRKLRRNIEPITSFYPYLSRSTYSDDALMLQVDAAVPRGLSQQVRADVCQEILVGILSGEVRREDLSEAVRQYVKTVYQTYERHWNHCSLDSSLGVDDDRQLHDIMASEMLSPLDEILERECIAL